TGKYRSQADLAGRGRGMALTKYMNARGLAILAALDEVTAANGATPAQGALAWLRYQPGGLSPPASATSGTQVEELIGSMSLKLSDVQLARLNAASDSARATMRP